MKIYHYIVKGRVQGVNFRYYTQKAAYGLQVRGTVKNLFNGDVEVYAQGSRESIEQFEKFLHQGPSFARVDQVIKDECDSDEMYVDFDIVY